MDEAKGERWIISVALKTKTQKLAVEEVNFQYSWNEYFEDLYNLDAEV